ncbi:Uncharacterised protein [Mycobacteroides abscessus subsp. massiliense]|uniref:hypothetical protein n=1 Tax=Mycobacteroides abscessus TaxID=36809 RepID=UPI0009D039B0|nr:hypothetical protein [Mycobacteroides abscessus]SLI18462.1 Uncharacterised protein [Mycobacteroides abscessus subsp. massiliense]SLI99222.1 Uncharacterised protein [Mycobacteroides abscessus subsp. massiliense]
MKWPRKPADWLINYIADRFYDRLRDRLLEDLAPWAGKGLKETHLSVSELLGLLP